MKTMVSYIFTTEPSGTDIMGDIKPLNSAGINDDPNTITNAEGTTARVIDLFMTKQEMAELQNQVASNTETVSDIVDGAPDSMDTFKEVSDNLDFDAFMDALEGEE